MSKYLEGYFDGQGIGLNDVNQMNYFRNNI